MNLTYPTVVGDAPELAYRDLLISYGAQLEKALLPVVRGRSMKLIVEACPNARFHFDFSCSNQVEILKAIGSQLIIDYDVRTLDALEGEYESYSEAWS